MSEFNNAIIDYLKASIPQGVEVSEITLETDLISTGIIDSFGIVGIVMFLEDTYGIEVSDDDIDPDIFRTVVSIASYIKNNQ
jgi:acyl carrier protein